jgi:hypothetical protein
LSSGSGAAGVFRSRQKTTKNDKKHCSLNWQLRLRCARGPLRLDCGDRTLPATADTALLVCDAPARGLLAQASEGRLYHWAAIILASGNCASCNFPWHIISRDAAGIMGNCGRTLADTYGSVGILARTKRFRHTAAGWPDGTFLRRRNCTSGNLFLDTPSKVYGLAFGGTRCLFSSRNACDVDRCGDMAGAYVDCDCIGRARIA